MSLAMHQDDRLGSLMKGLCAKLWEKSRKTTEVIQTPKKERSATSPRLEGPPNCGDSALWRGHTDKSSDHH